jgi:hypothetical protein
MFVGDGEDFRVTSRPYSSLVNVGFKFSVLFDAFGQKLGVVLL